MAQEKDISKGQLELEWARGFQTGKAAYISSDTIIYKCGNKVVFASERGNYYFHTPEYDSISQVAVHAVNKVFAYAEAGPKPRISITQYPDMQNINVIKGSAKLEYIDLTFSHSIYLLGISGVPEFTMTIWNYTNSEVLVNVELRHESPTYVSFNPSNWREICISYEKELALWHLDQSNDLFRARKTSLTLPYEEYVPPTRERKSGFGHTRDMPSRSSTRMTRLSLNIPDTAIVELTGKDLESFLNYKDSNPRMVPLSHAWMSTGDITIGCKGGQILRVDMEKYHVIIMGTPGLNYNTDGESSRAASAFSPSKDKDKSTLGEVAPPSDILITGSVDYIAWHKNGLYAAGAEGIIRRLSIKHDEVKIAERHVVGCAITSIGFNNLYTKLAAGCSSGALWIHEPDAQPPLSDSLVTLFDHHHGKVVGIDPLFPGTEFCFSAREDGTVQIWTVQDGALLSTFQLGMRATATAYAMLTNIAVVGTETGHVFFIDTIKPKAPRIIHRVHLHKTPVKALHGTKNGLFLLSGSDDGYLFIMDFRPSKKFAVLGHTSIKGEVRHISSILSDRTGNTKVAVTSATKESMFLGANKISHFNLPVDLPNNLQAAYGSQKKDLKDETLNKLNFNLANPGYGLCFMDINSVYVIGQNNKKIHRIILPSEAPKKENSKDSFLYPVAEFTGHQLSGGLVTLSAHGKWLVTTSGDGKVTLRASNGMEKVVERICHDYQTGGSSYMSMTMDSQRILLSGNDGTLCCFKWMFLETKGKTGKQLHREFMSQRKHLVEEETSCLSRLPEWSSYDDPRMATSEEKLQMAKEERLRQIEEAIEKDEIYQTPTPVPGADATWLEIVTLEAHQMEEKQYAPMKTELRMEIRDMRRKLQEMLKHNKEVSDIEKLGQHEFDLDVEEQQRLEANGMAEVKRIREEKELENLAKLYLASLIKKECWDDMEVQGRGLCSLRALWEVTNYPLRSRSSAELHVLEIANSRRMIEKVEQETRKQLLEIHKQSQQQDEENLDIESKSRLDLLNLALTGSLGPVYGGESDSVYNQFDLHTRHQRRMQIIFLQDAIHRMKQTYNKIFDDTYQRKESEISKVKEKNRRMMKILSDLKSLSTEQQAKQYDIVLWEPCLTDKERPELILTVTDDEIKVEKYLSPEEQKLLAEREKEEAERRAREKKDNWRERGLDMMMGGVLEVRKEDELKREIPKPAFLGNKAEGEYTDEDKRQLLEYEKKVRELNEEREKYKKQLEQELKKIQGSIDDSAQAFDDAMKALFFRKIKTDMAIYQEELKIVRLKMNMQLEQKIVNHEIDLHRKLNLKRYQKGTNQQQVHDIRKKLEHFRDEYERILAEDKVMDREFKRKFNDVTIFYQDALYRLFRRRPRGQRLARLEAVDNNNQGNPYAERPSTASKDDAALKQLDAGMIEIDAEKNMPEGLDKEVWQRFCQYRRQKIDSENLVRIKANTLGEMETYYKMRQQEDQKIVLDIEQTLEELSRLRDDKHRYNLNLEVQLLLKQGQVEVEPAIVVPDYSHCVLIHRSSVEDLNTKILDLGRQKLTSMIDNKDFRKGIVQLEWGRLRNTMEMEDLRNRMRDIQSMKVTREIQKYLSTPDYDAQVQKSIQTLEQTLLLMKEHHEKQVRLRQKHLREVEKAFVSKEKENSDLDVNLEDLSVSMHERKYMCKKDNSEGLRAERYKEIVHRRRLVELAKAQAQEVAVLRAEVERLRMRTFPALVQIDH